MISAVFAAVFTFSATATGVEKGTPLEFMFAGGETDRDYETMFLLEGSVADFWRGIERCGIPRGKPADYAHCRLWPVGATLTMNPPLSDFVDSDMPEGLTLGPLIYTGGTRDAQGNADAATNMPAAVFSLYSLAQSPLLFNGIYEQGVVYGAHTAKLSLKKGERRTFKLTWDEKTMPRSISVLFKPGNAKDGLTKIRNASRQGELDVDVSFADDMTVKEAGDVAHALATVDSVRVKINGRGDGELFYRAFLPLTKWKDRRERLTQPFEITIGENEKVIYIEEDWSVDGNDPKLTEKVIPFSALKNYPKTDTAFFFVHGDTQVGSLKNAVKRLPKNIVNHYVYWE